jgi:hypothetical protein
VHALSHTRSHTDTHTHTAGGATRAAVAYVDFDPRLFGQPPQGAPSDSGGAAREAAGACLRSRPARVRRRARTEEAQKEAFEEVGRMSCARPPGAALSSPARARRVPSPRREKSRSAGRALTDLGGAGGGWLCLELISARTPS